jgi:hypothetical protein
LIRLLFIFLLLACLDVAAQKDNPDSLKQIVLGIRYHSGFIFAHNIHVQNTKGIHPDGFELEYAHQRTDSAIVAKFKCYPRSGFSFTYIDFNKDLLGKSYSVSYFLEPNYKLNDYLKMNVRAAAGFSYLTNPFDAVKNPTNQSYSGHINSFLQLGVGLSCNMSRHFAVYTMGSFFHNSNGGFKEPNSGVNYINASLGLLYYTHSTKLPVYTKEKDTSWKHQPVHYDVTLYYSPKSGYNGNDSNYKASRKFILGISLQAVKQVSNLDAITVSSEVYYDEAMRSIKRIFIPDSSSSNVLAGFLVGHQFLLNKFIFSQEFGVYIYKDTKRYNESYQNLFHPFYQRWGLNYKINEKWSIGINMLAHYQIADYIDGRIIYRLK